MSKIVTRLSVITGNFAVFTQPAGEETPETARAENSDINAPTNDLGNYFDITHMHSAWNYLNAQIDTNVVVPHDAVAAGTGLPGMSITFTWHTTPADYLLYQHNLGYEPLALAVLDGKRVHPGAPIRSGAEGSARYCRVYCTSTQVRLKEIQSGGSAGLAAENITYRVIVIPNPPAPSGDDVFRWLPLTDTLNLNRNQWSSDQRFLHRKDSGAEFGFAKGKTMFAANGAVRIFNADGSYHDTMPASAARTIIPGTGAYGPSLGFTGSPATPEIIGMEVPS